MTVGLLSIAGSPQLPTGRSMTNILLEPGMFKNYLDTQVSFGSAGGYAYPDDFAETGYPLDTATIGHVTTSNVGGTVRFESTLDVNETLVFAWTGTCSNPTGGFGGVQLTRGAPGFTVVSDPGGVVKPASGNNLLMQGTDGYVEFKFTTSVPSQGVTFQFTGGSTYSGMTRCILCRKQDYASLLAGYAANRPEDMIRDDWVALYRTVNFKVARFMGMVNSNQTNGAQSRYLANWRTSLLVNNNSVPAGAWVGKNTTDTDNYTFPLPSDSAGLTSYYDGEVLVGIITNANTGAITVNSGSRGAKSVYQGTGGGTGTLVTTTGVRPQGTGVNNGFCTFVYNAPLDAFFLHLEPVSSCLPYELQCAICNRINAHLWTNFPTYITDDSVTAITQIVRDYLRSGKQAYFEYSNEVWNSNYPQTPFATLMGNTLGLNDGTSTFYHAWYGLRTGIIARLVNNAWSPRAASECKPVTAFQCVATPATSGAVYLDRLSGRYLAPSGTGVGSAGRGNAAYTSYCNARTVLAGVTDLTQTGRRPVDQMKVLSYAPYWSAAHFFQFPTHYIQAYASMGSTGKAISAISKASPCRVTSTAHGFTSGDRVLFDATIGGMTELRSQTASITVIDANNYDLYTNYARTTALDSSAYTTYTSGGNAKICPDISVWVQAAIDYAVGNTATAYTAIDADILSGTNNTAGATNCFPLSFFNNTSATSPFKGYELLAQTIESQGHPGLTNENYEGGFSNVAPDIAGATALGCTTSSTVTLNSGSTPYAVNWTGHPFINGSRVGLSSSGGALPSGITTLNNTIAGIGTAAAAGYFVVNAAADGFDISLTYGGTAIILASAGTGTITCVGHTYPFETLLWNYKLSDNFKAIVLRQFKQNIGTSVGDDNEGLLTHTVLPDIFLIVGPNAWSASTGDSFAQKFKSWDAAVEFNN